MYRYVSFIIRFRALILSLFIILTLAAAVFISRGEISTSMLTLFLGEDPAFHSYKERIASFGGDEVILVGLEQPEPFKPENLRRLENAVNKIKQNQEVERVDSILSARRISGIQGGIQVDSYAEDVLADPTLEQTRLAELVQEESYRGLLITPDTNHNLVLIELKFNEERSAESGPDLVRAVEQEFLNQGFPLEKIHLAGNIPLIAEVIDQTFYNLMVLFPIVSLVLLLAVFLMFGRLWPVFITGITGGIAVIWTMAFGIALDPHVNIMMAMVPPVILIISFSDVIHLCSSYMLELTAGLPKREAILKSGAEVGKACLYTSLTTFAGFVSLSLVPTPIYRILGLMLGFGVAAALLIALTIVPLIFSLMAPPRAWKRNPKRNPGRSLANLATEGFMNFCHRLSTGHPRKVVLVFFLIMGVSVFGISRLNIDTDFSKRMSDDNRIRKDSKYFDEKFPGTSTMEIFLDTGAEGGVLEPDFYARVGRLRARLLSEGQVESAFSLLELVDRVHEELNPGKPMPRERPLLAQYLLLLEMSGAELGLDRFVDFSRASLRMLVRVPQQGFRALSEVGNRAAAIAEEEDLKQVTVSGTAYLIGGWLDQMIIGQRNGLSAALAIIGLMMIIGLRSLRAGLWSMIPNLFPILVLGGVVGLVWEVVDSDVLGVAAIAIGIGVDNTIHFLMRYRLEWYRSGSITESLDRTFHFSGRAIIITSVVLIAGFLPLALSQYFSIWLLGTLLPLSLGVALIADLLLVPALARLGWLRFPDAKNSAA